MRDSLLRLLAGQARSCLFYIQEAAKLFKSCQALRLQKKGYYNIFQSQVASVATSTSNYRAKNNIKEHHSSSCSWLIIQQL